MFTLRNAFFGVFVFVALGGAALGTAFCSNKESAVGSSQGVVGSSGRSVAGSGGYDASGGSGERSTTAQSVVGSGGQDAASSGGQTSVGGGDASSSLPSTPSVLERGKHGTRDGLYVDPLLTKAAAQNMHLDHTFKPTIAGHVHSQILYVANGPGTKGAFYLATADNNVYAIAEADGSTIWMKNMGTPAGATGVPCGNVQPIGVTGTPVIDLPSRTIYLDAVTGTATTIQAHIVHALSIDDGMERPGFPFDPSTISYKGTPFNPVMENQRGALALAGGTLYVPYGGHGGDCGDFRGWVIGIPTASPANAKGWSTAIRGGGIWAPGGLSTDGKSIFAATGNTFGAEVWSQGEAVIRLSAGPTYSGNAVDYFTPTNWEALDAVDMDLGGSGSILVDAPGATPSALVVALGKDGFAYLLDRNNLGGIGANIATLKVASSQIINVPTTYTTAKGTYVVFYVIVGGEGVGCPAGQAGNLVALKIGPSKPPTLEVAWCTDNQGIGSPIVSTPDGTSNFIVWSYGAEKTLRFHSWDGDTGAPIYAGGGPTDVLETPFRRLGSPIIVNGKIVAGADDAIYVFKSN